MHTKEHMGLPLPYLVQRMEEREGPNDRKGVEAFFCMNYMGSAEFEFGALPNALRRIRAILPLPAPVEIKATRDGVPLQPPTPPVRIGHLRSGDRESPTDAHGNRAGRAVHPQPHGNVVQVHV